uniref:Malonyl-CoA:ACP transacylase (MAT) domain-containing protein n=1 Tax=Timema poppense TaxID=170557 RepID=A0A7R9DAT3_TIMPO|nr:unnamed protein product [Timema poppensis]
MTWHYAIMAKADRKSSMHNGSDSLGYLKNTVLRHWLVKPMNIPFNSLAKFIFFPLIDIPPQWLESLKLITDPKPRSSKWISSSVPESEWDTPLAKYSSPEYHTNNLLKEVLFEESTTRIPNNAIVIEIAPHGLLQAILRRSFGSECIHIPLTLRGHPNSAEFLLTAVGKQAA